MKHFFFVNETNVLRLVLLCLLGREVYVVDYRPYLRVSQPILRALAARLIARGKLKELSQLQPDALWCDHMPLEIALNDGFARVEKKGGLHVDIARRFAETVYDYPSRKAQDKFLQVLVDDALRIRWLENVLAQRYWTVLGAKRDVARIYEIAFGERPKSKLRGTFRIAETLSNLLNLVTILCYSLAWLARRTRPGRVAREPFFLCADAYAPWMKDFFRELVDRQEDVLIYYRNQENFEREGRHYRDYRSCFRNDARVDLAGFLETAGLVICDAFAVYHRLWNRDPDALVKMLTLASHRAMYRAFFKRFPVKFFWSQEDYSETHTVLSLEARRIGAKTLGGMHGIPHIAIDSHYRHVDFDAYFIIGRHYYTRYQHQTWPPPMKVVAVGSLHTRGRHIPLLGAPRPKDILVFVNPNVRIDLFLEAVYEVARHFSDRKVVIKGKPGKDSMSMNAEALYALAPANCTVIDASQDPYGLLLDFSYCLTIATSLAGEAVQFGCITYLFDLYGHLDYFYYHDFPGLCVSSGRQIIDKIERIEAGEEKYPWPEFDSLVERGGVDFVAAVREEMGLSLPQADSRVA